MLVALMAMSPTAVAWERRVGGPNGFRSSQRHRQGAGWFRFGKSLKFLVGHDERGDQRRESQVYAVNCWRTVVLLATVRAKLSRAVPSRSMVVAGAGVTVWALPNGPPTPDA
jgi:hypothetical protein